MLAFVAVHLAEAIWVKDVCAYAFTGHPYESRTRVVENFGIAGLDVIVVVLTWIKTATTVIQLYKQRSKTSLSAVLLRDGTLYFMSPDVTQMCLGSLTTCRFILNLRRVYRFSGDPSYIDLATTSRLAVSSIRFTANLGAPLNIDTESEDNAEEEGDVVVSSDPFTVGLALERRQLVVETYPDSREY
ncbi:hypothetical protein EIP91_010555 [Steccherinum ochraceum]|uniref:Uncharacterized protein n=1 Tax=Steccherinum ochraceum TaxID=92696 RepID=A0A4R0R5R9_9APHY|nr:hypothetical protein EIP91_010555 [Steccherinum ochraceum]